MESALDFITTVTPHFSNALRLYARSCPAYKVFPAVLLFFVYFCIFLFEGALRLVRRGLDRRDG